MTVKELNRNELMELKQKYYCQKNDNVSYEELIAIDKLVSDNEIFDTYNHMEFTKNDFFCNLDSKDRDDGLIFESNLKDYKTILEDTREFINAFSKGDITLKEVGEKYSKKLANIMFNFGYAGWFFRDLKDLEEMKQQMADTINDDYDFKTICPTMRKEDIIQEIYTIPEENIENYEELEEI